MWHNLAHEMKFRLSEATVVRVLAPIHHHLEYELLLVENHGPYQSTTIIEGQIEDHHTGIFAQLSPGEYSIKLAFTSDATLLQIPCQTIQLEMAMMTLTNARAQLSTHKNVPRDHFVDQFDINGLLA